MTVTIEPTKELIIDRLIIGTNGSPKNWLEVDVNQLVTEDDTPVDNIFSEKNQRLLTEPLYSSKDTLPISWPFLATANVGLFDSNQPAIVPDVLLSLGVQAADGLMDKENRSYLVWKFGKVPEVVIEIVSNKIGEEDSTKQQRYASMGILYYVIFDPAYQLSDEILRVYQLDQQTRCYRLMRRAWFPVIGLGLMVWEGEFEGKFEVWLRWCDKHRNVIPTGKEEKEHAQRQAKQALRLAEESLHLVEESQRLVEQERHEKERLVTKLRELGVDLESM
jgi:hypothetical protein